MDSQKESEQNAREVKFPAAEGMPSYTRPKVFKPWYSVRDDTLLYLPELANARKALDMGTGIGVLAIHWARRFPHLHVTAVDINQEAIVNVRENVAMEILDVQQRISVYEGNLFELKPHADEKVITADQQFDAIVFNGPHFPKAEPDAETNKREEYELCSTHDPELKLARRFFNEAADWLKEDGFVVYTCSDYGDLMQLMEIIRDSKQWVATLYSTVAFSNENYSSRQELHDSSLTLWYNVKAVKCSQLTSGAFSIHELAAGFRAAVTTLSRQAASCNDRETFDAYRTKIKIIIQCFLTQFDLLLDQNNWIASGFSLPRWEDVGVDWGGYLYSFDSEVKIAERNAFVSKLTAFTNVLENELKEGMGFVVDYLADSQRTAPFPTNIVEGRVSTDAKTTYFAFPRKHLFELSDDKIKPNDILDALDGEMSTQLEDLARSIADDLKVFASQKEATGLHIRMAKNLWLSFASMHYKGNNVKYARFKKIGGANGSVYLFCSFDPLHPAPEQHKNRQHLREALGLLEEMYEIANAGLQSVVGVNLRKQFARRSAIAAIMARNMSHNIGSHVLAATDLVGGETAENMKPENVKISKQNLRTFHNYLQHRMDFIAQVVTYAPSWGEPSFFFQDVMQEFVTQNLLLTHLTKDQGYPVIQFAVRYQEETWEWNVEAMEWRAQSGKPLSDFLVSIPGGNTGAHAFYDILENILRNSAKYGERKDKLILSIEITEESERYLIRVWDNLSTNDIKKSDEKSRVEILRERLSAPLIQDETGATDIKSYGVHELKECARILSYPHQWLFRENNACEPLWSEEIRRANEYKKPEAFLCTKFYLQKARMLGIVGANAAQTYRDGQAHQAGVFFFSDLELLANHPCQLTLVFPPDPADIKATAQFIKSLSEPHTLDSLPYRLLLVSDALPPLPASLPANRVRLCSLEEAQGVLGNDPANNKQSWEKVILNVYELWLHKFASLPKGQKHNLVISFAREQNSVIDRWKKSLESFHSNLLKVYLCRATIDKNQAKFQRVEFPANVSEQDLQLRIEKDLEKAEAELLTKRAKSPQRSEAETEGEEEPERIPWSFYDNHGACASGLGVDRGRLWFYHEIGLKNFKIFNIMQAPPDSEFGFGFFVLGLLEAASTKILIVDERVSEACFSPKYGFGSESGTENGLIGDLIEAGCHPLFSVWQDDSSRKFISTALKRTWEDRKSIKLMDHLEDEPNLHEQEGLYLTPQPFANIQSPGWGKPTPLSYADFVIFHQGVIDILHHQNAWKQTENLETLKKFAPSLVITSGRGKTLREVPGHTPFLEFSVLRESTYAGMSKYHLVRALMSISS